MKVILKENVENLGKIGDIVNVSNGYVRNFLLPNKLAVIADEKNIKAIEHYKKELEKKKKRENAKTIELAKKIEEFSCTIAKKVGENEKLFGSVTAADIAEVLNEKGGFKIDKKMIQLNEPIKQLGVTTVPIKLNSDIYAQLKVWVVEQK
jgi:large subunit ribosomal protein L9